MSSRIACSRRLGNVDVDSAPFVGRSREQAQAKRLLGKARLLTFTGTPGVGKSRLARHVARQVNRRFADGTWLVDLAALQTGELLPETVLNALEVHGVSGGQPLASLIDHLADKRLLLVLDNCEHLLDACAELVDTLLAAAPRLRILVTSRQALNMYGERIMTVPSLSLPEEPDHPWRQGDGHCEAVELFTLRAAEVRPGFVVAEDNWSLVARICRRLEGIPLAIELAAAWLTTKSVAEISVGLDHRFGLLKVAWPSETLDERRPFPRHQTLRATVEWSYSQCSWQEQTLWVRLSVFADGFDLDAAEICGDALLPADDLLDVVDGLIVKSVVSRCVRAGTVRFRLPEMVRQYGHAMLDASGQDVRLHRTHRDHYLNLAERADAEWFGPRQGRWLELVRLEHANLRAALEFSLVTPGEAGFGLRIAGALWFYWLGCGLLREGRHWLNRALPLAPTGDRERAKALWADGFLSALQGEADPALQRLARSSELACQVGDESLLAGVSYVRGIVSYLSNDQSGAVAHLEETLRHERACGEASACTVLSRAVLALACALVGDTDRAASLCEDAIAVCRAHRDKWVLSWVLAAAAMVSWSCGDVHATDQRARNGLRRKMVFRDRIGSAQCVELLAWTALVDGDARRAATLLGAARSMWDVEGKRLFGFSTYLAWHDECVAGVRELLGDQLFEVAFRQGTQLAFDQAVREALAKPR
ncbi:ATP-binding protein [Kutzneria kofuensis]|uniref:Non-specific serine/threonine protein kinase n=1 Tax=Kutzneria kofuensis TaxID=103725 RepID=A0A7W9NN10_9PSEU|nr:AAA family ATPase [Kutzneria kofuensis]MBB5898101.1 non-specific serine/threonine protein kinase [Kutzneria kofuensis]